MPILGETQMGYNIGYKDTHRYIWKACLRCGKERWVHMNYQDRQIICRNCASIERGQNYRGENSPRWNGGRRINGGGYIDILLQPDDFFFPMAVNNHYIREHRLIMAKHLGRCLHTWELVHHKNGNKTDNRIENLRLVMRGSNHSGQIKCPYCHKEFSIQ